MIGDTLNLATRLQEATKELDRPICFSEYTYSAIKGIYRACPLGALNVRGRQDPVNVYALDHHPSRNALCNSEIRELSPLRTIKRQHNVLFGNAGFEEFHGKSRFRAVLLDPYLAAGQMHDPA